ncbi:hypothetical protein A2U01_0087599, partial [Trifolium medium]|nr:hypothetical protein [Trifolium medium]
QWIMGFMVYAFARAGRCCLPEGDNEIPALSW